MSEKVSPKLKRAMERIKKILEEEDVAGLCVIHEPGFSEYYLKLDPSYSCCKFDGKGVKIRAKKEELGKEKRDKMLADTSNMLYHLTQTTGSVIYPFFQISEDLDKQLNAEHIDLKK